jgi:hypothetical protein
VTSNLTISFGASILCVLVVVHDLSWLWSFLPFVLWVLFSLFDGLLGFFDG